MLLASSAYAQETTQDRCAYASVRHLCRHRSAGPLGHRPVGGRDQPAGGIVGRQIELIYEDSEANPAVAVTKAEKLFTVDNVDFLTGTVNSGATLAVGQVADRADKLIATTVSFSDAITGSGCSPNVFRVNARAGQQSVALAAWLKQENREQKSITLVRTMKWAAPPSPRSKREPKVSVRHRPARFLLRSTQRTIRSISVNCVRHVPMSSIHRSPALTPCVCSHK